MLIVSGDLNQRVSAQAPGSKVRLENGIWNLTKSRVLQSDESPTSFFPPVEVQILTRKE